MVDQEPHCRLQVQERRQMEDVALVSDVPSIDLFNGRFLCDMKAEESSD